MKTVSCDGVGVQWQKKIIIIIIMDYDVGLLYENGIM